TPEWRWQVASATRTGIIAAQLAEQGLTAADGALDGDNGFVAAYAGAQACIADPPPFWWALDTLTFKPYPGCAINQQPVFQLLEAVQQGRFDPLDVERITLYLHPSDAAYPGVNRYGPFDSPGGAVMSAPFMLQVALQTGTVRHSDFSQRYAAGALHECSRRIEVRADLTVPR